MLNFVLLPLFLRFLLGPTIDKYFLPWIGRRKSYLYPCKILAILIYLLLAYNIDNLLPPKASSLVPLVLFFLCLATVFLFEIVALNAFKWDYLGRSNAGAIGAASTLSSAASFTIGLHVFTLLNSDKFCKKYLGTGALLSHKGFLIGCAAYNVIALLAVKLMKEDLLGSYRLSDSLGVVRVIKSMFRTALLRKFLLVHSLLPATIFAMKSTSA